MASVVSIGGGAKVIGSWQKVPRLMASLPSVVFGLAPPGEWVKMKCKR
uniref:Uncharacterized protein n=1 Tax=Picea glauca TaxID=3330 RepID=A0A101M4M0_PICGL|nr:hypothetical protein ABT39_MTgene651 [Picea glauca]